MKNIAKKLTLLLVAVMLSTTLTLSACANGNLVKKETVHYDDDFYIDTIYTYNNGILTEKVENWYSDGEVRTTKDVYNYDGKLLVSQETYHLDNDVWEKSFVHRYGYDQNGNEIFQMGYGVSEGKESLFATDVNEYNDDGTVAKVASFLYDDELDTFAVLSVMKCSYNSNGQLLSEEIYSDVEFNGEIVLDTRTVYVYNQDGSVKEYKMYDADDMLIMITRYTYDENGNVTLEQSYHLDDGEEVLGSKSVNEYDQKGRLVKQTVFNLDDESGELEQDYYTVYEY